MLIVLTAISGLSFLFWLTMGFYWWQAIRRIEPLEKTAAPVPEPWPCVSVVVPACNEAATLEEAFRSLLRTTYPNVELIMVDDRSTDETPEIVDRLAPADDRVRAIHVRELPAGWLGKVHAMETGRLLASGEWVLFTDADVNIAPDTLERAIARCEAERLDYLTMVPRFLPVNLAVDAAVTAMARGLFGGGQVWRSADPGSPVGAGFGAFLLVRATLLERSAGLAALRMEVADDVAVGLIIKRAGGRCAVARALDHVSLRFYASLDEVKHSMEKGGFAIIGRYSATRTIVLAAASIIAEVGFLAAFVPAGVPWLTWLGLAGLVTCIASSLAWTVWLKRSILSGLLSPFGAVLNAYFVARSGVLGWRRAGVLWRGTFYPSAELRRHQIVQWPPR